MTYMCVCVYVKTADKALGLVFLLNFSCIYLSIFSFEYRVCKNCPNDMWIRVLLTNRHYQACFILFNQTETKNSEPGY